jgi:hypothetical protein
MVSLRARRVLLFKKNLALEQKGAKNAKGFWDSEISRHTLAWSIHGDHLEEALRRKLTRSASFDVALFVSHGVAE